jgi:hypothetical protein
VVIIANADDPVSTPKQLADVLTKEKVDVGHSGGGGRLGLEVRADSRLGPTRTQG